MKYSLSIFTTKTTEKHYLLGDLVLDGVALLPGHGDADLLQPVEALLLSHGRRDRLLDGDALGPGDGFALATRHSHTLLPENTKFFMMTFITFDGFINCQIAVNIRGVF